MSDTSINPATLIQDRAAVSPDAVAIHDGDKAVNFAAFGHAIDRVALALAGEGDTPGTCIGIAVSSAYAHWIVMMAAMRLGAKSASLSGQVGLERARMVRFHAIACDRNVPNLAGLTDKFIRLSDDWLSDAAGRDPKPTLPDPMAANSSLSRFVFSSGTTGHSKAILHGAENIAHLTMAHAERQREASKYLSGYGIEGTPARALGTWAKGGSVIFAYDLKNNPQGLMRAVEQSTYVNTSVASLVGILNAHKGDFSGRENRIVRPGGAALPVTLRNDALARLCSRIEIGYGSMEMGTMAEGDARLQDRHPGAVGYPARGAEIQVVSDDGTELPQGQQGRLRVRTPSMVHEYYGNPEATAESFRDGWFYPGDVGYKEPDGLIVVLGRTSDVLNVGGVKFSANLVEDRLLGITGIKDACALAVPAPQGMNVMVVLAVRDTEADDTALEKTITERLGAMDLRNFILRWVDAVPRNRRGKIARDRVTDAVRQRLWP